MEKVYNNQYYNSRSGWWFSYLLERVSHQWSLEYVESKVMDKGQPEEVMILLKRVTQPGSPKRFMWKQFRVFAAIMYNADSIGTSGSVIELYNKFTKGTKHAKLVNESHLAGMLIPHKNSNK